MKIPKLSIIAAAVVAFIVTFFAGIVATSALSDEPQQTRQKRDTTQTPPSLSDFPTNANGLTYGSDAEVEDGETGPDLVAVVGDSGVFGYVRSSDLNGPEINSPEEARRWQESRKQIPTLNVYDESGTKVVDTFTFAEAIVE